MTVKMQVQRNIAEELFTAFPDLDFLSEQLRLGNAVELSIRQLTSPQIEHLEALFLKTGASEGAMRAAHLATLRKAFTDGSPRFSETDLEMAVPAIANFLMTDAIRGWMFTATFSARPMPYCVTRLDYTPPSQDEAGKVYVELKANAKAQVTSQVLRITTTDIVGKTVAEIFAEKGLLKESRELIDAYDAAIADYYDWRSQYGAQFSAEGTGFFAEDPGSTHRRTDWSRKDIVVLSSSGGQARLVNDESVLANRDLTLDAPGDILGSYLRRAGKSNAFDAEDDVKELDATRDKALFTKLPIHPYILMFHLDLHHYVWVHVDDMVPYAYEPGLKEKLVLPPEQTDLIDILTAEMDVLMDDIVAGKSGGTTVLCAGPPGVGKTLTAEVYSEIIKRPLYRVHSGQLGLNAAQMEAELKQVLTRAQRWGAVMLIDEADVYIKRREDDIAMNAVVGVFLRVLEYFNGLLFLTTNRVDDIDEAIVSRCIALIKYYPPDNDARARIWTVMSQQFGLSIPAEFAAELAHMFPAATGRDIKGLAKLVSKYCQHKDVPPTKDVFIRCSIFRGIDLDHEDSAALGEGAGLQSLAS